MSPSIPGFDILGEISRGGMAIVYRANQSSLQREVALKVISSRLQNLPDFKERFLKEARIVAKLGHPNIVTIFDVGDFNGTLYISMELLIGGDLRARLRNRVNPTDAISILSGVARGLDIAHKQGFVHRDLKPENILFREDGTPVITDFGIAKSLEDHDSSLTATGMSLGTPAYMAPEQFGGGEVSDRSDLYSLGVIFYEMLVGEKPFNAKSASALLYKHTMEPIPRLPDDVAYLQSIVDSLLNKDPFLRLASAAELHSLLESRIERESGESTTEINVQTQESRKVPNTQESASERPASSIKNHPSTLNEENLVREHSSEDPGRTAELTRSWKVRLATFAAILLITVVVGTSVFIITDTQEEAFQAPASLGSVPVMNVSYAETPMKTVLEDIADHAKMNLVAPESIKNIPVTIELRNAQWQEVLESVLLGKGYRADLSPSTITIHEEL